MRAPGGKGYQRTPGQGVDAENLSKKPVPTGGAEDIAKVSHMWKRKLETEGKALPEGIPLNLRELV